jgi:hypothetical protein
MAGSPWPATLPKQLSATARESLADVRGYGAKAEHHPHVSASQLREVAATALRKTTSQKAAAADIDIHEGRLSHKLQINFLSAWFGVSLLCWLWLWIMAHAVSAAEALRQQHLQQTTPRRRQSDRISEAKARQVFDAIARGR